MPVPAFSNWPNAESPLLGGIVDSIRARSKAFNKLVPEFDIEIVTDAKSGTEFERLNLEFRNYRSSADRLNFAFWDDGIFWLDARKPSKSGWVYEFSFYGKFNDVAPDAIRDMIENSLWINETNAMQTVWAQCKPYTE